MDGRVNLIWGIGSPDLFIQSSLSHLPILSGVQNIVRQGAVTDQNLNAWRHSPRMECADLHGGSHPLFTFSKDFKEKAWFWKMKNCMSCFQFSLSCGCQAVSFPTAINRRHHTRCWTECVCVCRGGGE